MNKINVLSDMARNAGYTMNDVEKIASRSLLRQDRVFIEENTSPMLASAVARMLLDSENVEFAGFNELNMIVYKRS